MDEALRGPCSWRGWLEGVTLPGMGLSRAAAGWVPVGTLPVPRVPQPLSPLLLSSQGPVLSLPAAVSLQLSQDPGLGACRGSARWGVGEWGASDCSVLGAWGCMSFCHPR